MLMLPPEPETIGQVLFENERMRYFATEFMHLYDIICFQEVFYTLNDRKEKLISLA